MTLKYNIRNKEGHLKSAVSPEIARRLVRQYMGEWTIKHGESVYEFKERICFGNADIGIWIFPGSYLVMEE